MKVKIDPNIDKELLIYIAEDMLNGTPPDLVATELGDEKYFPIVIEDNEIFYHGTSKFLGEVIKETGMCTPRISGVESTHGADEIFLDDINITNNIDLARRFANDRAKADNSSPVILEIKGKDINEAGCKAFIDPLYFTSPISSIVLRECPCIKVDKIINDVFK